MFEPDERSRRDLLKAAVAIGGSAGLSACLGWLPGGGEPIPTGSGTDYDRQYAWRDLVRTDEFGNTELPRHQVLLYLNYDREGPPTEADRRTTERAFASLDRAYERSNEGLVYSVAYSPAYFERFEADLPETVDLPRPRPLSDWEAPTLDEQDALVHLASDRADAVLEAEQALTGDREVANTVEMDATLADVFTVDSRRTGFVGRGLPADHDDAEGVPGEDVPEESPLFMGFKAGLSANQASEDYVAIETGPFAGGTTKHVSNIRERMADWYREQDHDQRVAEMYSPTHAEEGMVEGVGDGLGPHNGLNGDIVGSVEDHAHEHGRVGHAQKAARANRDEDGNVRLIRRHVDSIDASFDPEADGFPDGAGVAGMHLPSLQREIGHFEAVRAAMNGDDATDSPAVRSRVNNGIQEYIFVQHRGNFLVPPTRLRALPPARPER